MISVSVPTTTTAATTPTTVAPCAEGNLTPMTLADTSVSFTDGSEPSSVGVSNSDDGSEDKVVDAFGVDLSVAESVAIKLEDPVSGFNNSIND